MNQRQTISVFGAMVTVDFYTWRVKASVDEGKAKHWRSCLEELLATKTLRPGMASKCAGLLAIAFTVAAEKYGRTSIRPSHAQARPLLHGFRVGALLEMAAKWFIQYLTVQIGHGWKQWWNAKTIPVYKTGCSPMAFASVQREGRHKKGSWKVPRWYGATRYDYRGDVVQIYFFEFIKTVTTVFFCGCIVFESIETVMEINLLWE